MTHGGESILSIAFKFINFAILLAILVKFAGRPLRNFLSERHRRIKEEIENRRRMLDEARSLKEEFKRRLEQLDAEIEGIRKKVLEEAYAERDRIISEAKTFAERLREQALLTKEQELKELRLMLRQEITKKSVEEAERLIIQNLKKEDHDRLVKDFLERLRSLN